MGEGFSDEPEYVNTRTVFNEIKALLSSPNFEVSFTDDEKTMVARCDAHQQLYEERNVLYSFFNGVLSYNDLANNSLDESVLVFT